MKNPEYRFTYGINIKQSFPSAFLFSYWLVYGGKMSANSEEKQCGNLTNLNQECHDKVHRFKDLKPKTLYVTILVGILIAFGTFGAVVFKNVEAASVDLEKYDVTALPSTRDLLQEIMDNKNMSDTNGEENWKNAAVEKLEWFIKAKKDNWRPEESEQWGLADSWLFACTIFTTVGYGNIAPLSLKGRIFCMVFAAIGIPLFSVVAGGLSSFITDVIHTCHAEYHTRKREAKIAQQKKDDHISPQLDGIPKLKLSLKHFALICLGYLCLGALFFSVGEGWSLFESFYYCFITLSTVGLGDYVPGHVHHTSFFAIYVLVGIVLLIMFFGAVEEFITGWCQKVKDKLTD